MIRNVFMFFDSFMGKNGYEKLLFLVTKYTLPLTTMVTTTCCCKVLDYYSCKDMLVVVRFFNGKS